MIISLHRVLMGVALGFIPTVLIAIGVAA